MSVSSVVSPLFQPRGQRKLAARFFLQVGHLAKVVLLWTCLLNSVQYERTFLNSVQYQRTFLNSVQYGNLLNVFFQCKLNGTISWVYNNNAFITKACYLLILHDGSNWSTWWQHPTSNGRPCLCSNWIFGGHCFKSNICNICPYVHHQTSTSLLTSTLSITFCLLWSDNVAKDGVICEIHHPRPFTTNHSFLLWQLT